MNSKYGDPFDGEKVSQLTTSFAPESESESDAEDQHREPGDPGTSMPVMDASLLTSIPQQPMMTPVSMVAGGVRALGSSTPNSASRLPTKLRRIEPKPLPSNLETPIAQATVPAVASSQAMTMPLTFVTVPQVPQQFHIQPQQLQQQQLQAQPLQLQHQPIQLQQSPLQHQPQMPGQLQPQNPGAGLHTAVMQSPPSIHIEISPQQQAQLLSPVSLPQQPTPPLLPPSLSQPQTPVPAQQQQSSQHQQQHTSASKKEERRKEKNKNHHNHSHEVLREKIIMLNFLFTYFSVY